MDTVGVMAARAAITPTMSMSTAGFEPTISAGERPQTYALDRAAAGIELDALISQIYFWNKTACFGQFLCPSSGVFHCTHSNGICHTGLLTFCEQDQDGTESRSDPARKLSAKLYDINHCCVYSEKFLMMGRRTVRNTQNFISKINLRN